MNWHGSVSLWLKKKLWGHSSIMFHVQILVLLFVLILRPPGRAYLFLNIFIWIQIMLLFWIFMNFLFLLNIILLSPLLTSTILELSEICLRYIDGLRSCLQWRILIPRVISSRELLTFTHKILLGLPVGENEEFPYWNVYFYGLR